jgi:hypothetical protein
MKRIFLCSLLIVTAGAAAFSQGASVTIQNEEGSTFYYTLDPPDLAQVTPGSSLAATKVADFFATKADQPQFTPLAPGAQASLKGLSDGAHILVGFFAVEGQDAFPVRMITLQADSSMGERFYSIYGSPALVNATRGVGRLAKFARPSSSEQATALAVPAAPQPQAVSPTEQTTQSANPNAEAAAQTPQPPAAPVQTETAPIASFSSRYDPGYFTRESKDDFSVHLIADSHSWNLTGTHIASFSASIDKGTLTVTLAAVDNFSQNVSYFIYAFTTRTAGSFAAFTLELRPRALSGYGACILWSNEQGAATPMIFGSMKVEGKTATLVANLNDEPPAVAQAFFGAGSFDLTSCWYDAAGGVYEEFYYATITMADIPVTR